MLQYALAKIMTFMQCIIIQAQFPKVKAYLTCSVTGKRERDRDRQRQTETDRQRQTDRDTERETETDTDRACVHVIICVSIIVCTRLLA